MAMIIPKTLKIGNLTYAVKYKHEEDINAYGKSSMQEGWLHLDSSMPKALQEETFFHEIIHQILDQKSYATETKNENLVDVLSSGIYQVLKDNKFIR